MIALPSRATGLGAQLMEFHSPIIKDLPVDTTVAACDAAPWGVARWMEFSPIPNISVPISATASSVRFEFLDLPFYEYTVERKSDDHYDVRLVFTGNGRDEFIF
jgi:hypothetical protein